MIGSNEDECRAYRDSKIRNLLVGAKLVENATYAKIDRSSAGL